MYIYVYIQCMQNKYPSVLGLYQEECVFAYSPLRGMRRGEVAADTHPHTLSLLLSQNWSFNLYFV